jgi:gamma-glutamylcyclotransferase (GGCT)/AIG2-like uncharacterized protein YtfP
LPASDSALRIFFYGTLMRGETAHHLLAGRATFVGDASVAGTLLALGQFPGIVAGRGRVRGEVWRLDAPELLRTLDDYEGYNFERRASIATLASGRRVRAWLYRYRGPRPSTVNAVIPEGDWRKRPWR